MKKAFWKTSGLTLIELMIAGGVFVTMMSISLSSAYYLYISKVRLEKTNQLYTETRFVMDRIVREVRVNTVDYYEYFNQNIASYGANNGGLTVSVDAYGENPGLYEMFFKAPSNTTEVKNDVAHEDFSWLASDRINDIEEGIFNTGADEYSSDDDQTHSALDGNFFQEELYLLSSDGLTKTVLRAENIPDSEGNDNGQIIMTKYSLGAADVTTGQRDWEPFSGFDDGSGENVFFPITPATLNVTDLEFVVSPLDDPYKAFAESVKDTGENPYIQPHVIIKIKAKLSDQRFRGLKGTNVEFELQTLAVSRVFSNVVFPQS